MSDNTLTIDKLRHASYNLFGIKWRVSPVLPDGMVLILGDDSVAVSQDIDQTMSSFHLLQGLEQMKKSGRKVTIFDLRRVKP